VRAGYSSRPAGGRKARSHAPQEKISTARFTSRDTAPPCPDEKARRVAALQAALAGTAPEFEERVRSAEEADR
jgi:hypothetical protein